MQSHITLPIDYSERLEEAKPITKLKKTINRKIIITATICVLIVLTFVSSIYISTKITYDIPSSDVTFYEANGKLLMKYKGHGALLYSAYASNIDNSPTKEWHISFTQTFFERYVQPLYKKDKPQVLETKAYPIMSKLFSYSSNKLMISSLVIVVITPSLPSTKASARFFFCSWMFWIFSSIESFMMSL